MINGKKIGLVLSGGGAKGFAHVGVIKVLEENGIKPDIVVGTSMGSVIGGLYASGKDVGFLEKQSKNFKISSLIDINVFGIIRQGLVLGKKYEKLVDKLSNNALIENFPIKYACVACDVKTGNKFVFDSGKLSIASRASSSIPGIFAPLKKDDMLLVDGGVIDNIPTDVAYQMGADYVIAVDCVGEAYLIKNLKTVTDILMSSFSLTQYLYNKKLKIRCNRKIVISNDKYSYFEHSKQGITEIIYSGQIETIKMIDKIKKDLGILNWYFVCYFLLLML